MLDELCSSSGYYPGYYMGSPIEPAHPKKAYKHRVEKLALYIEPGMTTLSGAFLRDGAGYPAFIASLTRRLLTRGLRVKGEKIIERKKIKRIVLHVALLESEWEEIGVNS